MLENLKLVFEENKAHDTPVAVMVTHLYKKQEKAKQQTAGKAGKVKRKAT